MAYRGKFTRFKNPQKYVGDIEKVTYRSLWEKDVMMWLDENPNVIEWASEEIFFLYEHPVENRRAKYYPDFFVKMSDGVMRIIEIKPKKETTRPPPQPRQTKAYLSEVTTWIINSEKWRSAQYYCKKSNMTFELWTEDTLTEMGIMKSKRIKPLMENKPKLRPLLRAERPKRPRPKRKS
jgi:hypothetical protein